METTTELFQEFVEARPQTKRTECKLGDILVDFSEGQREAALKALNFDPKVQSTASIARVITRWGFPINPDTVQKHRVKECACFRDLK